MAMRNILNSVLKKGVVRRFNAYKVDIVNKFKYGLNAPLKYQLLYCEPSQINSYTRFNPTNLPEHLSYIPTYLVKDRTMINALKNQFIVGGDWDKMIVPINCLRSYRQTIEKLRSGRSWQEVGEFERNVSKTIALTNINRKDKEVLAENRFKKLDELIKNVEETKYLKSQFELKRNSFREMGGIEVFVGREGELIQAHGGRHRLAIARHFSLSVIPVCVSLVHEDCVKSGKFSELKKRSLKLKGRHEYAQKKQS
ncbi:hypothetical protein [Halomonas sp. BC04]|uniref:hypothetical protein n=1 Tax=Halomonas sp. BC04 TaxID=1403540 RepID=UPI0012DEE4DF|nr:hypothetical protein [Halomonas sp. BC04]